MADDPLVIGDIAIVPELIGDYAAATFNYEMAAWSAGLSGCVSFLPASPRVYPTKDVDRPSLTLGMADAQLDLTNATAVDSSQQPEGVRGRGPVVSRRTSIGEFLDAAIRGYTMSSEQASAELGRQAGLQLARGAKVMTYNALLGAVTAISTSTHKNDETSNTTKTLQLVDVFDGKALLGDAASQLRILLAHSTPFASLEKDMLQGTYNLFNVGDMTVMDNLPGLKGMRVVLDDDVPTTTVSAAATNYNSFLLGPGAAWVMPATGSPDIRVYRHGDKGDHAVKVLGTMHYAVGVAGMDYDMDPTNPTAANLATSGNWAEAFSCDHKDVKAALIITQNG